MLNVASVGAFGPVPGQATYAAAKAFVLSYTDAMREELRRTGVTVATLRYGHPRRGGREVAAKVSCGKRPKRASTGWLRESG
ncbi:MAG: SDR family NAD(P)-dependent oxidoreductase [Mycobacterium sp.]